MNASPSAKRERARITRTIQCYVDGGKSGRSDQMREAFHPDATIFGYAGADLFAGPIEQLFDWVDENGAATGLQARIEAIDVFKRIATVRLELDNWSGRRFTDMFTLLKVDGRWKIISKVFYLHRKKKGRKKIQ